MLLLHQKDDQSALKCQPNRGITKDVRTALRRQISREPRCNLNDFVAGQKWLNRQRISTIGSTEASDDMVLSDKTLGIIDRLRRIGSIVKLVEVNLTPMNTTFRILRVNCQLYPL